MVEEMGVERFVKKVRIVESKCEGERMESEFVGNSGYFFGLDIGFKFGLGDEGDSDEDEEDEDEELLKVV